MKDELNFPMPIDPWFDEAIFNKEDNMDDKKIKKHSEMMRERSGHIKHPTRLVAFLYCLIRDHVPPGIIEEIMLRQKIDDDRGDTLYSNGWLAQYAIDLEKRLTKD